jgi:hypothetical protein
MTLNIKEEENRNCPAVAHDDFGTGEMENRYFGQQRKLQLKLQKLEGARSLPQHKNNVVSDSLSCFLPFRTV